MTFDINDYYGVTVSHGEKIGPKKYKATAQIFRRDTQEDVGNEIIGHGANMNTADNDALEKAKKIISNLGIPTD